MIIIYNGSMANEQNVNANENRNESKTNVTVNRTTAANAEAVADAKKPAAAQQPEPKKGAPAQQKQTTTTVVRNTASSAGQAKPAQATAAKPAEAKQASAPQSSAAKSVTVTRSGATADAKKTVNTKKPATDAKKKEAPKPPYSNMKAREGVLVAGFTLTLTSFLLTIICALFLLAPGLTMGVSNMSHLKMLTIVLLCTVILSFVGAVFAVAGANTKKPMAKGSFFMGLMAFWFGLAMLILVLFFDNVFPIDALVRLSQPAAAFML